MNTSPVTSANQTLETVIEYNKTLIKLGRGVYGHVYVGCYKGTRVAVKRILRDDLDVDREINAMENLNHENVLKLINKQQDSNFMYLVLELCQGTVEDYVRGDCIDEIVKLMPPEAQALNQMACGLDYIHQCSFVHRDIKPANVLISTTDSSRWNVLKISDFGFTKPITERKSFSTGSLPKGTPIYMAPEYRKLKDVADLQVRRAIRSDVSIDVFSLGCLFYTYVTRGKHAFATPVKQDEYEIIFNISNGKKYMLENGLDGDHYAFQIIDGMTQAFPKNRWKLKEVIGLLANRIGPNSQ